ncbi:DUF3068 domain-containing protein [Micromonosporaceae bacterium DT194]|uniref:DUF3068 domain-containing protein n=1 Tax=Melissospora conviva TaxID=3388432 RepID=UPI003C1FD04F
MKARIGAVLFGIGIVALVLAAGLYFYVAPSVTALPYDLKACPEAPAELGPDDEGCLKPSVAEAKDAKFLYTDGTVEIKTGRLLSTTKVVPRPDLTAELEGDLADKAVVWDVWSNGVAPDLEPDDAFPNLDGWLASSYSASLALDRKTAEAVEWNDQFLDASAATFPSDEAAAAQPASTEVAFKGLTYKFPFNTEKKSYEYYDRDLGAATEIKYDGTDKVAGLDVYRFKQVIENQQLVFPADRLAALAGTFGGEGATTGAVTYSNTRTIWVEPVTGNFIRVQEQQNKTFTPDVGEPTALLDGTFVYTEETEKNSAESAKASRDKLLLVGRTLPIALTVLGALLVLGGLLIAMKRSPAGATNSSRHRADQDETLVS